MSPPARRPVPRVVKTPMAVLSHPGVAPNPLITTLRFPPALFSHVTYFEDGSGVATDHNGYPYSFEGNGPMVPQPDFTPATSKFNVPTGPLPYRPGSVKARPLPSPALLPSVPFRVI